MVLPPKAGPDEFLERYVERMKKKFGLLTALFCLCAMFLAGCGEAKLPDAIEAQTVFISAEGQITLWLVGDFSGEGYKLSELTAAAVEEVAEFNKNRLQGDVVAVEKVEALEDGSGRVAVTYKFGGWKSCTDFIGNEQFYGTDRLFFGTVAEALEEGYGEKVIMKNVKDNTLYTDEQLKQAADRTLVVTDVKANIYCPGKVAYISDGAVLNEDGSVGTFGVEGLAYILLK